MKAGVRNDDDVQARTLQELVTTSGDGGPYDRDLVEDALAVLVLTAPGGLGEPTPEVLRLLGAFAARAGVLVDSAPAERQRLITQRLQAAEFPERLVEAIGRLVLEVSDRGRSEAIARFTAFAGETRTVEPQRPPAANQVRGGQLARLHIDATLEASAPKKNKKGPHA